ncbi:MAG TPA: protein-disulfide reductase DsbD domain-containing protein [Candidatus Obscuribacterales bacterium]
MKVLRALLIASLLLAFALPVAPPPNPGMLPCLAATQKEERNVEAGLIADVKQVKAGQKFRLGVELLMKPGWHTYYKESGEAGKPTKIEWQLPEGFTSSELLWEKPTQFNDGGIITFGYHDQTVIASTITAPSALEAGKQLTFKAKVEWLQCKELCVPGKAEVELTLPSVAADAAVEPGDVNKFSKVGFTGSVKDAGGGAGKSILEQNINIAGAKDEQASLISYFGFALLGGFILNFMPCVLPVIAIKVISLVEQANDNPRRVRLLGLTFAAGIIASFLVLAAIVLSVQAAGQKIGWGFQFQYPPFVIAMATIVLVLSLSLFGLFYVSFNAGQATIDRLASKEGFVGTFFKGVLATVLSTPCTAPALGTALGFAFSQPAAVVVGIFFTVGLGMSLPYLILTINPNWMRYMPRPGVWMEKFKESMGFILLATVVWLLGILGTQVGEQGVIWTGYFLVAVSLSVWIVGRFTDLTSSPARRLSAWTVALLISGIAFYVCIFTRPELRGEARTPAAAAVTESADGLSWEPFTIEKLDKEIAENKTVFLDFTAAWCLTCQANEQVVLRNKNVVEKLKALKVVTMKADWTNQDPVITQLLQKFHRSGVPLYVIFPAGRGVEPIVLPEVITPSVVLEKLEQAGPSKG